MLCAWGRRPPLVLRATQGARFCAQDEARGILSQDFTLQAQQPVGHQRQSPSPLLLRCDPTAPHAQEPDTQVRERSRQGDPRVQGGTPPAVAAPAPRQACGMQRALHLPEAVCSLRSSPSLPAPTDARCRGTASPPVPGESRLSQRFGAQSAENRPGLPKPRGSCEDEDKDPRGAHGETEHGLELTSLNSTERGGS